MKALAMFSRIAQRQLQLRATLTSPKALGAAAPRVCHACTAVVGSSSRESELQAEQRDYVLGITSVWMLVPAAHSLANLLVSGGPPIDLLANPHLPSLEECELMRRAAVLAILPPTCVVSLAAWRFSDPIYSSVDRWCARSFFVALLATNLAVPDYALAVAAPASVLVLYGFSASSERMGFPRARLWTHAAFRCAGFWWAFASSCDGLESIEPWYFGLSMAVYWGHIAYSCHWSARVARFHRGPPYARGCATVAMFATAATLLSPSFPGSFIEGASSY